MKTILRCLAFIAAGLGMAAVCNGADATTNSAPSPSSAPASGSVSTNAARPAGAIFVEINEINRKLQTLRQDAGSAPAVKALLAEIQARRKEIQDAQKKLQEQQAQLRSTWNAEMLKLNPMAREWMDRRAELAKQIQALGAHPSGPQDARPGFDRGTNRPPASQEPEN